MRSALTHAVLLTALLLTPTTASSGRSATLISGTTATCSQAICKTEVTIPHVSPTGRVTLDLHVWHARRHALHAHRQTITLALLVPGAVIEPRDYTHLATQLARRGFAVAIPSYTASASAGLLTQRDTDALAAARRAGVPCPRRGNFVTAAVLASVSDFLATRAPSIQQRHALLLGHSLGAVVAVLAALGGCAGPAAPPTPPALLAAACEGLVALPRRLRVSVLVLFEGQFVMPVAIPPGMLVVHVYSPFYQQLSRNNITSKAGAMRALVTEGRERFLDVALTGGNHFLPVDFQPGSRHARTKCKPDRPPPEDAFTSTAARQARVVKTCALVAQVAYLAFGGGLGLVRCMLVVLRRLPMVKQVRLLEALEQGRNGTEWGR